MKKILLIVFALLVATTICSFAQEPVTQKTAETKTLLGKVASVTLAEPVKGVVSGTIKVIDETGKTVDIIVDQGVKILDSSYFATTLDKIRKDDKVEVEYLKTKEGSNEATSINIVK